MVPVTVIGQCLEAPMDTPVDTLETTAADDAAPAAAEEELLVEDVSIDGMCGVY